MVRKAPKIDLGRAAKGGAKRPTFSASSSETGGKWKKYTIRGLLALAVLAVLGAIIWAIVLGFTNNSGGTYAETNSRSLSADSVDRDKDTEDPIVKPTVTIASPEVSDVKEESAEPVPAAEELGIDKQFTVDDAAKFDQQFQGTSTQVSARQKVKSSQLGLASVMPQFSVSKQPSRQVGMSLDLVYNELRGGGPKKMSSVQVPFGGSDFQEELRQAS